MAVMLWSLWRRLQLTLAEDALVQEQVALDNLRQLRFGAALLVPLSLLACALILPNAWPVVDEAGGPWQLAVGLTHLADVVLFLLVGLAAQRLLVCKSMGWVARALPGLAALIILLAGLVLVLFYEWVEPKTSPMVLTAIGVALMLYLRPLLAAVLYGGLAVLGFMALPLTQPDPGLLASARISAVVVPMVALVFSLLSWRRNTVRLLLVASLAQANAALALKQTQLEDMAWYDGLTGLCNRSEFMRRAETELQRAQRHGHHTSFLLLDLDHFKQVNDRFGHPTGDLLLCHVARLLRAGVRSSDLVARLGGEEFIVLLPQTGLGPALQCAEKLRLIVQDQTLETELGPVPMTVSLGVLEVPPLARADMSRAYAAMDRALYRAKAAGRNRWEAGSLDLDAKSPPQAR